MLVLGLAALAALVGLILVREGGWDYYRAPVELRSYSPAHRVLRPAGRIGHVLGLAGLLLMLVPVAYAIRKQVPRLRNAGSLATWLDVHVLAGIAGPVLVTLHTSFKFNGLVSVAYWSMVAVVLSGFIGRYLYVRIPRSLRGLELTRAELEARARVLGDQLASARLPEPLLAGIEAFELRLSPDVGAGSYASMLLGELRMPAEVRRFRRGIGPAGLSASLERDVIAVATERATLGRRIVHLERMKRLFELWHVLHMPLVYVMFGIVLLHTAVTMYMGYVPFMD